MNEQLNELMGQVREDRVGSQRAELMDTINNEGDPYGIADAFKEMSEFEKSLGHLYGQLMIGFKYAQVDATFEWYQKEYGNLISENGGPNGRFTEMQKNFILVHVIQQVVGASQEGYRLLRKILVKLNQSGK